MGTSFSALGGSDWQLTLSVGNDGSLAEVTGFTVYFSETLYTNLALVSTPSTWNSLIIQPDRALAAPGFLDAYARTPQAGLRAGQVQSGFAVRFTYLGTGLPPGLPFEVVNPSFQPLSAGQSVAATSLIPETSTTVLMSLGLAALAGLGRRRLTANDQRSTASAAATAGAVHA
ncbi:MAG: MYXO-CTERM sorting domain-containing protein [Rubrivivax sp.]|nr:MYXO-CTERM sorting domain-containing protein [Rubrivivax sp.]